MKSFQTIALAGAAILLGAAGCATRGDAVKRSEGEKMVDLAPADGPKGYIEFFTVEKTSGVRIYRVEGERKPQLLAVFGLRSGARLELAARESDVPLCERLRVAAAPGQHTFLIERGGKTVTVTVAEDKVTPVEVDFVRLDRAVMYDVYKVDMRVLPSVASAAKNESAKAE